MMLERKRDWNFAKDKEIYSESNVWISAQRLKMTYGLDADIGFE